jgi:hypothetical protein
MAEEPGLLAGIKNKILDMAEGETVTTNLLQDKYDFNYLVFPNDLGQDYLGHYMIININVPTKGLPLQFNNPNEAAGEYTRFFSVQETGQKLSKVDSLRFAEGGLVGGIRRGNTGAASLPRQTRRIKESIALFMPTGLNFMTQNAYEDISLAAQAGKLLSGAGFVGAAVAGAASGTLAGVMRNPINPGVEVIFTTTMLRSFIFRFLMAPRNEQESINMQSIIRTMRFHGAPEINTGAGGLYIGTSWIPPAEFDITFFHRGKENQAIPRINTCVLERIDVDYHPFGKYATFSNGHPVAVTMDLAFKEVEVIHKQRVLQNF